MLLDEVPPFRQECKEILTPTRRPSMVIHPERDSAGVGVMCHLGVATSERWRRNLRCDVLRVVGGSGDLPGRRRGVSRITSERNGEPLSLSEGKLVRDRIPEIIRSGGAEPVTYVAEGDEYRERLHAKLQEEVAELLEAEEQAVAGELADVLEVIHALAVDSGMSVAELESLRSQKARERGGFDGRVVWIGNAGSP
ncbi:nucleoside triphosphate pyrophosphohydrolase [Streptomyces sp. NPDC049585]|uniref:nucleoside triphosphate pyrophosphohydrolase n=1 Tax=Streptomyces sp. NPDC049585 TaxID=3155154 RepID=UPI0034318449